ncbi:MAG: DUF1697 domain-containing protein [Anaerolineales bacterium]|nr:DUF1697 domain-containing protein [Anaerolineales bacterium]
MKFVAFIRNINVGQTRFPSRSQLEQAFLASGARSAVSFQSNGTVVIELVNDANLEILRDHVSEYLRSRCNFSEAIFVRDLESIRSLVHQDPYAVVDCERYPHRYVSYYEFTDTVEGVFPLESPKQDCLVFAGTGQEAYSIARDIRGISGYPTPVLERRLQVPVTTRSWTTLLRLTAKFN